MPSSYARPEFVVGADWLAQNMAAPGLRVLDCRWRVDGSGRRLHAEGHIRGSIFLDWASALVDADSRLPFALAGPSAVAAAMTEAGVSNDSRVVLLDDTYSLYAARAWWSLRAYGLEAACVLDGGWPAWLASGQPVSTAASEVEPADFSPADEPRGCISATELLPLLGAPGVQIIDARPPADYLGQGGAAARRGHIPGALNLPAALLVREGSQQLPDGAALGRLLASHGISDRGRSVVYDATGIGAAKVALCLELMGFAKVAVYDGGWPDWASRDEEAYPVES